MATGAPKTTSPIAAGCIWPGPCHGRSAQPQVARGTAGTKAPSTATCPCPAPCWMSYLPPSEGFLAPSGLSAGTRQHTAGQQWQAASSQGPTCTTPSPRPPRAPIKCPAAPCPEGLLKAITSLGTLNLKPPDLLLGTAISPCPQSPLRAVGGVNPLGSGQRAHGRARRSETG